MFSKQRISKSGEGVNQKKRDLIDESLIDLHDLGEGFRGKV